MVYNGGAHRYAARLRKVADAGYADLEFQGAVTKEPEPAA
jgi:hypothetical protein